MAQKYYNSEETAKILDLSVDEVRNMLDRRELHGYRDGADWKFKVEEIDALAKERQSQKQNPPAEEEGGDVLLSEVALGQSSLGTIGTVIAMDAMGPAAIESDIHLAGSDMGLVSGDTSPAPLPKKKGGSDSKISQFEELDLTLDEDVTLEDSSAKLPGQPGSGDTATGGSAVDLSGRDLEDDDLVLGGSDVGSDVSIGADSGISLVDPADSGLSLEAPLDLSGASSESLELGEDDMLLVGEGGGSSPTQLKTDDDFLLTPLEEAPDADGSESGSQVIALDTEGDESVGMLGGGAGVSMAAMLDEDISSQPALDMGMGAPMVSTPLMTQPGGLSEGVTLMQPGALLPEAPYSSWQIAGLVFCALLLMLCGMMMYDLIRNMWSWDSAYTINSSLMDMILGLFEGK